jgi:hypothetical protein
MSCWAGRLRQSLQQFNYNDDDYSDDDASLLVSYMVQANPDHDDDWDLQVATALRESFEGAPGPNEDVVMGGSITSTPSKFTLVESDDECCLCWDKVEHGGTYFQPPCKHIYCYNNTCISNPLLNKCTQCNQGFNTVEPITAIKVKVEDLDA